MQGGQYMSSFGILENGSIEQIEKSLLKNHKTYNIRGEKSKTNSSLIKELRGSCPDMQIDIDTLRGRI